MPTDGEDRLSAETVRDLIVRTISVVDHPSPERNGALQHEVLRSDLA